jgi:hypothetical protein
MLRTGSACSTAVIRTGSGTRGGPSPASAGRRRARLRRWHLDVDERRSLILREIVKHENL